MYEDKNKYALKLIAVLLFAWVAVFPTLGTVSLWDIDAGRYLVPAKNAIEHGKWLIPEYNGHPRIVKPPLMVWLVALSSIAFNGGKVNEFSARIPSALAAMGTLLLLFYLVKANTEDEELGLWACFFLASSLLFIRYARADVTDMVLLFFITTALFAGYMALEKRSPMWLMLWATSCGLGYMDKGPVAVVLPAIILFLYCYSEGLWHRVPWPWVPVALLLLVALCLWWPLAVGPAYWREFILQSNIKRAFANPSWKTGPFFYIFNFPAHFAMPSVLIPTAAYALKRYRNPRITLFIIWFTVVFVLFSISDTKRSSYILPLYPAAAVIAAYGFMKAKKHSLKIPQVASSLILAGSGSWLTWTVLKHGGTYLLAAGILTASLVSAAIVFKLGNRKVALVLACSLFALSYSNLYQPVADRLYHSPKRCIEKFKRIVGDEPIYVYGSLRANEYWYWGVRRIPKAGPDTPPPFYFYTRKSRVNLPFNLTRLGCCTYQRERLCLFVAD